jgi:hypothetical protein
MDDAVVLIEEEYTPHSSSTSPSQEATLPGLQDVGESKAVVKGVRVGSSYDGYPKVTMSVLGGVQILCGLAGLVIYGVYLHELGAWYAGDSVFMILHMLVSYISIFCITTAVVSSSIKWKG